MLRLSMTQLDKNTLNTAGMVQATQETDHILHENFLLQKYTIKHIDIKKTILSPCKGECYPLVYDPSIPLTKDQIYETETYTLGVYTRT